MSWLPKSAAATAAGLGTRVALFAPDMGGGGAERVVLRLLEDLAARGVPTDLLLVDAAGELMPLVPPQTRVVALGPRRLAATLWPLVRYLRRVRPAALLGVMWPLTTLAVLARLVARVRTRVVTADHSTLSRQYADAGPLRRLLLRASLRLSYRFADARVSVSDGAARDLAALAGLGADRIEVLPNPIDLPDGAGEPDPEVERLWGIDRSGRILSVGTLAEGKDHALLIRSFARIARQRPCKLMILGEGNTRSRLEALVEELGLGGRVLLPGFRIDPWPYYRSAKVFALASRFEGQSLVIVEALHAGLTIVSTDCDSGPRELLAGGRFGTLVPVGDGDALAQALGEALDREADGAALRRRARELSGAASLARYRELLCGGKDLQ